MRFWNISGVGLVKYEKEFRGHFAKEPMFTFGDTRRFLGSLGASEAYAKLFIHNQIKRHGLLRIGKGRYTFRNDEAVVGFGFRPFYYGMEYALTLRRLWTQMANPVVITATKAVPGTRQSMGRTILVRRISRSMFFGIEYIRYGDVFIPVSDVEKTLIDFIYYRVAPGEGVLGELVAEVDPKKMGAYKKRCGKRVRAALSKLLMKNPRSATA